jgi:hypothetical protein
MTQGFVPGLRVIMADGSIAMLVPGASYPREIACSARTASPFATTSRRLPATHRLLDHA